MVPSTPIETNRRLHKVCVVCEIRICLDECEPAYLDVAIERGLMLNLDHTWQNGMSHVAHSVIPSYTNPNPNKSNVDRGVLPRNKIDMAFCSRGGVAHKHNELRESPATAYRA